MSPGIARKVVLMFQKIAPPKQEDLQLSTRQLEILGMLAEGRRPNLVLQCLPRTVKPYP